MCTFSGKGERFANCFACLRRQLRPDGAIALYNIGSIKHQLLDVKMPQMASGLICCLIEVADQKRVCIQIDNYRSTVQVRWRNKQSIAAKVSVQLK